MARIVSKKLRFTPVPGASSYVVYWGPNPHAFDYDKSDSTEITPDKIVEGKVEVDLLQVIGAPVEGVYDFAVTAVDDAGNESDFSAALTATLDFTAPAAPTGLELVG